MTTAVIGADEAELRRRADELAAWSGDPVDLDSEKVRDTWITGTVDQVVARLRSLEEAGVQRVYLQHLVHRDLGMVELIGRELVPAVA
jgi:alkanesulfonate monooxygenase SsuD/methylene tetrahydromethanopterin reductase-like flavin-dependent oxidoreductase (luciferase family)